MRGCFDSIVLGLLGLIAAIGTGCADAPSSPERGPACEALLRAAERGGRCDETLQTLAQAIERQPSERACIEAVRTVLGSEKPSEPRVRSVYEPPADLASTPLSDSELAAIAALRLPASMVISPDVGNVPGIPPTSAWIDERRLDADPDGRLATSVDAGPHTLRLRHAGRESSWCVDLAACETLELVAHGGELGREPRVRPGACER